MRVRHTLISEQPVNPDEYDPEELARFEVMSLDQALEMSLDDRVISADGTMSYAFDSVMTSDQVVGCIEVLDDDGEVINQAILRVD